MAGDYIIMRLDLCDDPDAIRIAKLTGLDIDSVIGKLHRIWSWADRHTRDGFVTVDALWLDEFVRAENFIGALCVVGWASLERDGIQFLNFDKHNGHNAKSRADSRKRSAKYREKTSQKRHKEITKTSQENVTTEEKRREEKRIIEAAPLSPTPHEEFGGKIPEAEEPDLGQGPIPLPSPELVQEVFEAWNSCPNTNRMKFLTEPRRRTLMTRLRDRIFADHWQEAIQKISASEFFAGWKPGFDWFLDETNFVKVLEGNYDHNARAGPRGGSGTEDKYDNSWLDSMTEADLKS